jgi:hypothetical protein
MADALTWARRYATYALQERLKVGNPKNDQIRARIAGIRAGNLDNAPEVRSVLLCITENASAIETRQGGDVQQAPSRSDESAVPQADAQNQPGQSHD